MRLSKLSEASTSAVVIAEPQCHVLQSGTEGLLPGGLGRLSCLVDEVTCAINLAVACARLSAQDEAHCSLEVIARFHTLAEAVLGE